MLLDIQTIAKYLNIASIILTIVGAIAALAGVIWFVVWMLNLIIEGLRLLQSAWTEASALLAGLPALHFLVLFAFTCVVIWIVVKLIASTLRSIRLGVLYVVR
jgi:hypothetical protein